MFLQSPLDNTPPPAVTSRLAVRSCGKGCCPKSSAPPVRSFPACATYPAVPNPSAIPDPVKAARRPFAVACPSPPALSWPFYRKCTWVSSHMICVGPWTMTMMLYRRWTPMPYSMDSPLESLFQMKRFANLPRTVEPLRFLRNDICSPRLMVMPVKD